VLGFPVVARRYGDSTALQYVLVLFFPVYMVFPFTGLIQNSMVQNFVLGNLILVKVGISVIALQSCLTLLTNAAGDNISTAHGLNFAIASISRGIGSVSSGLLFSLGTKLDLIILPYWFLGLWALITLFARLMLR
jgi:predicted MFS family arabinose efflux permease